MRNASRFRFLLLAALAGCLFAVPAGAAIDPPRMLADSTFAQAWKLGNGLRVVTRHVPGSGGVSMTVAYDIGSDDDPPGREGLAMLLAEVGFTAAAGDIPERSYEDLASLRPLGWSFLATRRSTMFTEISTPRQFPGVLNQVAARMRGVTVTREGLRRALASVRTQMADRVHGPVTVSLYYQVRELAAGHDDRALLGSAPGRDLERMTPAAVQQQVARLLVPANAVLSVAGNLEGVDVPALVQNLFGSLPAGTAAVPARRDSLRAGSRLLKVDGIEERRGVVGILAPPLTDPEHPSFYLCSMMLGSHFSQAWKPAGEAVAAAPGTTFHYALFDEPELVRLFPPGAATTDDLGTVLKVAVNELYSMVIPAEAFDQMRDGLAWLLGGPMDVHQLERTRTDASALHTLTRSMAGRELFGGEAVWAPYRERFAKLPPGGFQTWMDYYLAPEHQVRLMTVPNR